MEEFSSGSIQCTTSKSIVFEFCLRDKFSDTNSDFIWDRRCVLWSCLNCCQTAFVLALRGIGCPFLHVTGPLLTYFFSGLWFFQRKIPVEYNSPTFSFPQSSFKYNQGNFTEWFISWRNDFRNALRPILVVLRQVLDWDYSSGANISPLTGGLRHINVSYSFTCTHRRKEIPFKSSSRS